MDISTDIFKMLLSASPEWITAIICIAFGYLLRPFTAFPNRFIPHVCVLVGGLSYSLIKSIADISPDVANPIVLRSIFGMIIGFAAWIFHKAAIKPLEDKFPALKGFLDGGDANASPPPAQPATEPKQNT